MAVKPGVKVVACGLPQITITGTLKKEKAIKRSIPKRKKAAK